MGTRYRKSINLGGGFRINFSKSGIGYSWGTKGYRITKTANGRTRKTYSIPGTGLSYVEENSGQKKNNQNNKTNNELSNYYDEQNLSNVNIENYNDKNYEIFLAKLNLLIKLNKIFNYLFVICLFLTLVLPIFFIFALIALIGKIYLILFKKINITYDINDDIKDTVQKRINSWSILLSCDGLWIETKTAKVKNKKIASGAKNYISRKNIKIIKKLPFYLKTNTDVVCFKANKVKYFIFPDRMILISNNKAGAIPHNEIEFDADSTSFVESEKVPKDTDIINYTWKYVNKNGGPDKRYKDNVKYPVCAYAKIYISSRNNLNIIFLVSSINKASTFLKTMNSLL